MDSFRTEVHSSEGTAIDLLIFVEGNDSVYFGVRTNMPSKKLLQYLLAAQLSYKLLTSGLIEASPGVDKSVSSRHAPYG